MENREVVRIVNQKQAELYIKNGLEPIRVYWNKILVFVFDKEKSKPLFDKWRNYELK